jgi:hypothetical protein
MGLLVAGITGGASLIDNARLTSLKREVDEHTRDLFVFYSMRDRLPGDLDGTRKIGMHQGQDCPSSSFPAPYSKGTTININRISCPFVDLYLAGVSSFKPDPDKTNGIGITRSITGAITGVKELADEGGAPFSKVYRDFVYVHRYLVDNGTDWAENIFVTGIKNQMAVSIITVTYDNNIPNPKTVDIAKRLESKFDDGAYNAGNIRAYCGNNATAYNVAVVCNEIAFFSDGL